MNEIMLIVEDNKINQGLLTSIFQDDYIIKTAEDGRAALTQLRYYGAKISVVLLDLVMPGVDGFEVLESMSKSPVMKSIPVVVVSGKDEPGIELKTIQLGASDYVTKPVDAELLRLRVASAISKANNARILAENEYILKQSGEEAKYQMVLESTGTVVVEYDCVFDKFKYDPSISRHIAGRYDERGLWRIFMSDLVADIMDVKAMQELTSAAVNGDETDSDEITLKLKTPSGHRQWFRMRLFRQAGETKRASKVMLTFNNIDDETLAREKLEFQAERDQLTGLYNRMTFFIRAAELLAGRKAGYYVMASLDIDKFKAINEQYGSDKGDEVLKQIADIATAALEPEGGVVGRISADNFAALYPASLLNGSVLDRVSEDCAALDGSIYPISLSIGRYIADDMSLTPSAMYDRAVLAKMSIKGRYDVHIALYNETMRERLLREQEIVNEMKPALEKREFEVWMQPQYNHTTKALIGAEALVRWRHPTRGIVAPIEFIPVFERNGFIYELDKYVWEQACVLLKRWTECGITPLPVSVNISRYDLFRDDFIDTVVGLVERYEIPKDLLRLEITETAFAQSFRHIVNIVKELIDRGFTVEIDDFGSGYSSLNTLKDVPAQVLKLDMRFLENGDDSDRGGNVLESVVRMAKWLGMAVIAEGVETLEQADFLKSIGCSYVQGYLYAKPMPDGEYETLLRGAGKEEKLLTLETVKNLNNNALWNPNSMDTLIFNSYVGAATIAEYHDGELEILRASEKFVQMLGSDCMTVDTVLKLDWAGIFEDKSRAAFVEGVRRSAQTGDEVTLECVFIDLPGCPKRTYVRVTLRVIAVAGDHYLVYCANENITAQREMEDKERASAEMLKAIMDNISGSVTAAVVKDDKLVFLFVNEQFYAMLGYTKEQFDDEVGDTHAAVHPDDYEELMDRVRLANLERKPFTAVYRIIRRDGEVRWLRSNVTIMNLPDVDDPVQLSVSSDITEEKLARDKLRASNEQLQFLNETAGELLAQTDAIEGINRVLETVRVGFGADRAFIFEYTPEDSMCSFTYEACGSGVESCRDQYRCFPLKIVRHWQVSLKNQSFLRINDIAELGEDRADEAKIMKTLGASSALAVSLNNGERIIGALGVFNPTLHLEDYDNLRALGDYVTIVLTRRDLLAKIESDRKNLLDVMNDTPGGFARILVKPDGALSTVFVNDNFCRMRGMTREEIIASDTADAMITVHPDDLELVRSGVSELRAAGKTLNIKYRLKHASGKYLPVSVFARMTVDENGARYINAYYADLDEQRE